MHFKATQDAGKCQNSSLQGVAAASWLTVARPLLVDSEAPPAHVQGPGEQNDPSTCFSSTPVITVNCKASTMTMERQIDLFLVAISVLNMPGVTGTQISHLVMALPGVDVSTIGT